jgi:hypothetical protein
VSRPRNGGRPADRAFLVRTVAVAAALVLAAGATHAADSPAERWKAAVQAMRHAASQAGATGAGAATPRDAATGSATPRDATAAPAQRGSDAPAAELTKADIQGLKLGMTLDETRAVFKTTASRKVVHEYRTTLVFTDASHRQQPVPNGRYVSCINAHNADRPPTEAQTATREVDALLACFVLTRDGERLAYVRRHVRHGQTRVDVQSFVDAVKQKYGTPTVEDGVPAGSGFSAVWRYGPPLPAPGSARVDASHANPKRAVRCWNNYSGGSLEWTPQNGAAFSVLDGWKLEGLPWECGAATLRIDWGRGNRYPVDLSQFLLEYISTLASVQLIADGIRHTAQLTAAAQKASVDAAAGSSVTVKPSKL